MNVGNSHFGVPESLGAEGDCRHFWSSEQHAIGFICQVQFPISVIYDLKFRWKLDLELILVLILDHMWSTVDRLGAGPFCGSAPVQQYW